MSVLPDLHAEQQRVVDVNSIGGDFFALKLQHIGEGKADFRAIVTSISHLALADGARGAVPSAEQPVSAGRYRREEGCRDGADRRGPDDHGSIAETKLRIRSEKLDKAIRVAGIDDRQHMLPPLAIGVQGLIRYCGSTYCRQHTPRPHSPPTNLRGPPYARAIPNRRCPLPDSCRTGVGIGGTTRFSRDPAAIP